MDLTLLICSSYTNSLFHPQVTINGKTYRNHWLIVSFVYCGRVDSFSQPVTLTIIPLSFRQSDMHSSPRQCNTNAPFYGQCTVLP